MGVFKDSKGNAIRSYFPDIIDSDGFGTFSRPAGKAFDGDGGGLFRVAIGKGLDSTISLMLEADFVYFFAGYNN